jgi:hypothetical protein
MEASACTAGKKALHWNFAMLEVNWDYHKLGKHYRWGERFRPKKVDDQKVIISSLDNALRCLGKLHLASWQQSVSVGADVPPTPEDYNYRITDWDGDVPVVVWLEPVWPPTTDRRVRPCLAGGVHDQWAASS